MSTLNLFGFILTATGFYVFGALSVYLAGVYSDWKFDKKMKEERR